MVATIERAHRSGRNTVVVEHQKNTSKDILDANIERENEMRSSSKNVYKTKDEVIGIIAWV